MEINEEICRKDRKLQRRRRCVAACFGYVANLICCFKFLNFPMLFLCFLIAGPSPYLRYLRDEQRRPQSILIGNADSPGAHAAKVKEHLLEFQRQYAESANDSPNAPVVASMSNVSRDIEPAKAAPASAEAKSNKPTTASNLKILIPAIVRSPAPSIIGSPATGPSPLVAIEAAETLSPVTFHSLPDFLRKQMLSLLSSDPAHLSDSSIISDELESIMTLRENLFIQKVHSSLLFIIFYLHYTSS